MEYKELIKLFNINKNDIVFFCSDIIKLIIYYKSIKKEFSPNNFIDSIIDEIGKGGTLIFPTYNWGFCQGKAFDIKNTVKALDAGCNLILHCNGSIKEMKILSRIIPKIDKFTQKKTAQFYKFLG